MGKKIFYLLVLMFIASCSQKNKSKDDTQTSSADNNIPEIRKVVNAKPVASYLISIGDARLDRKFGVEIYETSQTFKYLLNMQYDGMLQHDTLKLPNFGTWPEVQIKAGDDKLSCIIGFLDEQKTFKEYKLLSAKNNELKLTRLKSYGVETYTK